MQEAPHIQGTEPPVPRYSLKAEISRAGYKHFYTFAEDVNIHPVTLSRVINGWQYPNPNLQRKLAKQLGLTIKELRELL